MTYKKKYGPALWVKPKPPKARKPLRKVSKSTANRNRNYARVKKKFLEENPHCEICMSVLGVVKHADTAHHIVPRSTAPSLVCEPSNLLPVCDSHHLMIHQHPSFAYAHGWLKRSTDQ